MKNIIPVLLILFTIFSCEKEYNSDQEFGPIGVIYDTVYICPDDKPIDSTISNVPIIRKDLFEENLRDKPTSRSQRFTFLPPAIENDLEPGTSIWNCAFKFWEDESFQADTLYMKNLGWGIGPEEVGYIGNAAWRVSKKFTSGYPHIIYGALLYAIAEPPAGQAIYLLKYNSCTDNYPLVVIEDENYAELNDYIILVKNE